MILMPARKGKEDSIVTVDFRETQEPGYRLIVGDHQVYTGGFPEPAIRLMLMSGRYLPFGPFYYAGSGTFHTGEYSGGRRIYAAAEYITLHGNWKDIADRYEYPAGASLDERFALLKDGLWRGGMDEAILVAGLKAPRTTKKPGGYSIPPVLDESMKRTMEFKLQIAANSIAHYSDEWAKDIVDEIDYVLELSYKHMRHVS